MTAVFVKNRVSRHMAVLALGLMASACANGVEMAYKDPRSDDTAARVEQLLNYCDRMTRSGDYRIARGMCLRAHNLDQRDPRPLMQLAEIMAKLDRRDASVEAYKKVLKHHPEHIEALYRLGKSYMAMKQTDLALSAFKAAQRLRPNDSRLHNAIAVVLDGQGEHAAAQQHYRRALELDPDNLAISSNLGLSLALSGNNSEAVAVLSNVVADPSASRVSFNNLQVAYQAIERAAKKDHVTVHRQTAVAPLELPPYMADTAIVANVDLGDGKSRDELNRAGRLAIVPGRKPQRLPKLPGPLSDTIAKQPPIPLLNPGTLREKSGGKAARTG